MAMTRMAPNQTKAGSFTERIAPVAEALRAALLPLVDAITGGIQRPSRLTRELGIDKSLASRLVQALRHGEPLEFLHRSPAPVGLRMVIRAAREQGAPAELCAQADAAVDAFQTLIESTPGGRGSVDGWIAAQSAAARERNEHRAKQAIFGAMSYLIGCSCESLATALVLRPSADGQAVDGLEIHQRLGLRRLRPSAPVALFSLVLDEGTAALPAPWFETLDGERSENPTDYLLAGSAALAAEGVEIVRRGPHTIFTLAESHASIDEALDLNSGYVLRHGWQRCANGLQNESRTYLLNFPARFLVRDVFIHEELWPGANPEISLRLPNPAGTDANRYEGHLARINTLDLSVPIEQLGRGLARSAVRDLPPYSRQLAAAFARLGWDPEQFRGYRSQMLYPVPMIAMTWWFPLPSA